MCYQLLLLLRICFILKVRWIRWNKRGIKETIILYVSTFTWLNVVVCQALFQKGVSEVDAEESIKLVFGDKGSNGDEELIHGLSKHSMDQLVVQASKQWLRGHNVPKETRKSRIVRWLQYRGFNWGVICFILNKLEHEYP